MFGIAVNTIRYIRPRRISCKNVIFLLTIWTLNRYNANFSLNSWENNENIFFKYITSNTEVEYASDR